MLNKRTLCSFFAGAILFGCAPAPGLPTSAITLASYQQIQTGMTLSEVEAVLGQPGEEMSRTESHGVTIVTYAWKAPRFGSLVCLFRDGRLESKSQVGLD